MRSALLLGLLLVLAAPASAGSTRQVDLPRLFAGELATIRAGTDVPVLLPQKLPSESRRHVPSGGADERGWTLAIGAVPDCGGATACFIASFSATRGERPHFRRRVTLSGGQVGYFKALSCGASCSPPVIEWYRAGVLYAIQATVGTQRTERRLLIRMANSAIRSGPR